MTRLRYSLSFALVAGLLTPLATSAITVAELNAQIAALMQQIVVLQAQMSVPRTTSPATQNANVSSSACPQFTRNLSLGSNGSDVLSLQRFLVTQGLLGSNAVTGSFGGDTQNAIQTLQTRYNIVSSGTPTTTGWGNVGPKTIRLIGLNCAAQATAASNAPQQISAANSCLSAPRPDVICSGSWKAVSDQYGCTTSWQCSVPLAPVAASPAAPTTQTSPSSCAYNPRPTQNCDGAWHALTDYKGCTSAWQCI